KEWKQILRDPFLISQVLLQVIYFLPAIYILFFTDTSVFAGLDLGPILAVVIVALSGVLTASIARITVVGEEAHDLLASSPVGGRTVRRGKLLAAVVPVLLLAVPTSVGIFMLSPQAGVVAALLSVSGTFTVGALRSRNPGPAGRRALFKDRSMGDPVMAVIEVLIPVMLAAATYLLAIDSPWKFGALFVGRAIFAIGYLRARGRGTAFAL